ncbi:MAG: hypothetical protein J7M25_06655 [Deltaproteobacteria bacterium]|nr:hypothetical protein [Deltaproteobacteria bacterium]
MPGTGRTRRFAGRFARRFVGRFAGLGSMALVDLVLVWAGIVSGLVFGTVSCGMAPSPSFTGSRFQTGVSPYEDLGPVEMCIGPHRIGPPDGEMGGFCVPRGTTAALAVCSVDADCQDREHCVCGHCVVKYCTQNNECRDDERCDFTTNRCVKKCQTQCDCLGPNARCDIGMCQQMCLVDAECQAGEICSLSRARCMTVACHQDSDCFEDEECLIEREPRHVASATVLEDQGSLRVWVDMDVHGQKMIFEGRGRSPEAFVFRAHSVLAPPPCRQGDTCLEYSDPVVLSNPDGYVMFFVQTKFLYDSSQDPVCGDGVCELGEPRRVGCPKDCAPDGIFRAVSPNGLDWEIQPQTAVLTAYYDWEDGWVGRPTALVDQVGGRLMLFYEAGRGNGIGLAVTDRMSGSAFPLPDGDRRNRTDGVRRFVLRPDQVASVSLWRAVSRVGAPFVMQDVDYLGDPYFRLWFSAYGFESPTASSFGTVAQIPANFSIGYAGSVDGVSWEVWPFNPVFDRIAPNSFLNHESEFDPWVVRVAGRTYMYYCGSDRDETLWDNLAVAVNPPLIPVQ